MSGKTTEYFDPDPGVGEGEGSFDVLLAEDNYDDVVLWTAGLKMAGLKRGPFIARDGVEAIEYLSGTGNFSDRTQFPFPQLMLLDLSMPRRNGFEVLAWWKSLGPRVNLTIIVLSGAGLRDDIERAYTLGAASFLPKPSDPVDITKLAAWALNFCKPTHSADSSVVRP